MTTKRRHYVMLSTVQSQVQEAIDIARTMEYEAKASGDEDTAGRLKTAILALETADEELFSVWKKGQ
jgi:hypothetical protein